MVRLATWNLARARPGGRRAGALLSHMRAVDADVWVLTETWRGLSPGPDYRCVAVSGPAGDREADAGEVWVGVWSRLAGDAHALTTADPERTAAARLTPPGARPTIVYGTVLPWLSDARTPEVRGAQAFCAELERQREDWARLRGESPDAGLCVAGDFNQDLAPQHHYGSRRGRAALADALARTNLVCLTAGSSDPVAARCAGRASIDHICVSVDMVADGRPVATTWPECEKLGSGLTDHFGVVATVSATGR